MSAHEELDKTIRKFRKKLRQIENLERSERELTDDEIEKVLKKDVLREQLQQLLQMVTPEESQDEDADEDAYYGGNEEDYDDEDDTTFEVTYEEDPESSDSSNFVHVKKEEVEAEVEEEEDEVEEGSGSEDEAQNVANVAVKQAEKVETKPSVSSGSGDKSSGDSEWKQVPSKQRSPEKPKQRLPENPSTSSSDQPKKKQKVEPTSKPTKSQPSLNKDSKNQAKGQGQQRYRPLRFDVAFLEGHSDLVCCVAMDTDHIVSAGRDTAIKIWSVTDKTELRSLGGHSGTVSDLILLNKEISSQFCAEFEIENGDQVIISASQDCYVKFWSLKSGRLLKSVYTFNPINCMTYIPEEKLLITGMGGGKVSAWDVISGSDISSLLPCSEPVTALEYNGDHIYSASGDGYIRVFKLRDRELHLMYVAETIRTKEGDLIEIFKPIRSMAVLKNQVYFGDEGCNVKVLDWKQGVVHKLRNHMTEFGSTDAIRFHGDWNLTSGYDIDRGLGFINVRNLQEDYIGTLEDGDTGLIMSLACCQDSRSDIVMVTGGSDLKLWSQTERLGGGTVELKRITKYEQPNSDSDMDSESELSDSEVGQNAFFQRLRLRRGPSQNDETANNGWFSWCTIL